VEREVIGRDEGRRLFGLDPAAYDRARPGHPEGAYELLAERCGLAHGTAVLEIGPGTGQATRRLLELGADPLVALEPDPSLAAYLTSAVGRRAEVRIAPLEEAVLSDETFDLSVAASSFHWVDEEVGLARIFAALRRGGWVALWWTVFGEPGHKDAFMRAVDQLFVGLARSPSQPSTGRRAYAFDVGARSAALARAGFVAFDHVTIPWRVVWDSAGIRDLYASFSPIRRLDRERRESLLDEVERIAEHDFEGRIERSITTSIFVARRPS
jgi:SAM-dependent methyltransferase